VGIAKNSRWRNARTRAAIPAATAPVSLSTANAPPTMKMNTMICESRPNPRIGAVNTCHHWGSAFW